MASAKILPKLATTQGALSLYTYVYLEQSHILVALIRKPTFRELLFASE